VRILTCDTYDVLLMFLFVCCAVDLIMHGQIMKLV